MMPSYNVGYVVLYSWAVCTAIAEGCVTRAEIQVSVRGVVLNPLFFTERPRTFSVSCAVCASDLAVVTHAMTQVRSACVTR